MGQMACHGVLNYVKTINGKRLYFFIINLSTYDTNSMKETLILYKPYLG